MATMEVATGYWVVVLGLLLHESWLDDGDGQSSESYAAVHVFDSYRSMSVGFFVNDKSLFRDSSFDLLGDVNSISLLG
ncbi:hypothetical protein QVD17_06732 [Tagetes erecta]|uniref:Uncharacterized protein n=1 Tax=Tagetes erecta TaxID=13708 RepID=A0AAD8PC20_TARER|nr:hypothetical protein QVD17_06732 [Tagetes erecta]